MAFRQAYLEMLKGKKVARRSWTGYWAWENETIMIHCGDGKVLDFRETDNPRFTLDNMAAEDWMVVD